MYWDFYVIIYDFRKRNKRKYIKEKKEKENWEILSPNFPKITKTIFYMKELTNDIELWKHPRLGRVQDNI